MKKAFSDTMAFFAKSAAVALIDLLENPNGKKTKY